MIPVVGLLMISLLPLSSEDDCGNITGCNGCGGTFISCQGASLTEFPNFSTAHAILVEELTLSGNHITAISVFDLQHFTALVKLDISSNDITYIEEGSFATNTNLSIIYLSGNPLYCDCGLRWLIGYLNTLPSGSQVDDWTCEHTNGSVISPTQPQLICECAVECGSNASCDLSTGICECHPGYTGDNCSEVCSQGMYGLNCSRICSCEAGNCHHITGQCTCFPDYYGVNCSHDCTGTPDCAALGREACSLSTPEHSCGACRAQPAGVGPGSRWGNSSCLSASSSRMQLHASTSPNPTPSLTSTHASTSPNPTPSLTSTHASTSPNPTPSLTSTHESRNSSNNLTQTQYILVVACPLIVLLLVVDILVLMSIVLCHKYAFKIRRRNRVSPLFAAENNLP